MDRDEQHTWVVVEYLFSPIPMMHIPVENANFLDTQFSLGISGSNCYIIKIAEATTIAFSCMVAWRSNSAESRSLEFFFRAWFSIHSIYTFNYSTCRERCTFESTLIMVSISWQFPDSRSLRVVWSKPFFFLRYSFQFRYIARRMDHLDLFLTGFLELSDIVQLRH